MIAQLRGRIIESSLEKDSCRIIVDVQGVGYEVLLSKGSESRVSTGQSILVHIKESVTAFDGAVTLYGFLTGEEKDLFTKIRDKVSGMGPKKTLDVMDKISKSLPDFKRAIIESDIQLLVSVFGFTKKTAEKLVSSLKGQADAWNIKGPAKWAKAPKSGPDMDAVSGLVNLGYPEEEARNAVAKAKTNLSTKADVKKIIQEALKQMGKQVI